MARANKNLFCSENEIDITDFSIRIRYFFGQNVHGIDVSHWQGNINWSTWPVMAKSMLGQKLQRE